MQTVTITRSFPPYNAGVSYTVEDDMAIFLCQNDFAFVAAPMTPAAAAAARAAIGVGAGSYDPFFERSRLAISKAISGSRQAKFLMIGDSNTAGLGSNGSQSPTYAGARAKSYPSQMVRLLTLAGIPARDSAWYGPNAGSNDHTGYDSRLTLGAGWSVTNNYIAFSNSTTTNAIAFTPTENIDRLEIRWVNGGGGVFTVDVDGGAALATITASGTFKIEKQVINCTRGTHTINIKRVSGNVAFCGVIAYDSTVPDVSIINAGYGGFRSNDLDTGSTTWGPLLSFASIAPDLSVIDIGINDVAQSRTAEQYKVNLRNIVASVSPTGPVIIVSPIPFSHANRAAVWPAYMQAMKDIAAETGALFLDADTRYTDYATVVANGLSYDPLHPNASGYADYALWLKNMIVRDH
jgi:lysophospholipase L1-like esterase